MPEQVIVARRMSAYLYVSLLLKKKKTHYSRCDQLERLQELSCVDSVRTRPILQVENWYQDHILGLSFAAALDV